MAFQLTCFTVLMAMLLGCQAGSSNTAPGAQGSRVQSEAPQESPASQSSLSQAIVGKWKWHRSIGTHSLFKSSTVEFSPGGQFIISSADNAGTAMQYEIIEDKTYERGSNREIYSGRVQVSTQWGEKQIYLAEVRDGSLLLRTESSADVFESAMYDGMSRSSPGMIGEQSTLMLRLKEGNVDGIPYEQWRAASRTVLNKTAAAGSFDELREILGEPDQQSPAPTGGSYIWAISDENNAPPYTLRQIRAVVLNGEVVGLGYYFFVPKRMIEPKCNYDALDVAWGHLNGSPATNIPEILYYDRAEFERNESAGPRQPWSVYGKAVDKMGRTAYLVGYCPLTPIQKGVWSRNPNFGWKYLFAGMIFIGEQSKGMPNHPFADNRRDWRVIP